MRRYSIKFTSNFLGRQIKRQPNIIKIFSNISWLLFDKVLRLGVGLLIGVWLARYLGPEQFGLLNYAIAFVGLFSVISGLGLQGVVVRDIVNNPDAKSEILGTSATLQLAGGLLGYILVLVSIFWLRPGDSLVKMLVAILGSAMLFRASELAIYWFESQVRSKYIVWVQNVSFLFFAAVKAGLIIYNAPLTYFAWASLAEAMTFALLMLLIFNIYGQNLSQLKFTMKRARILLLDSWPLLLSGMTIMIYMRIDQIMLGQILGDEAVGIYSAGIRISEVWYFIPTIIVASVFPVLLEAKQHSETKYDRGLQQLYDVVVLLCVAVAVPMTFLATPILSYLYGNIYAASGPILAIHIWASIFVSLGIVSGQSFVAEGNQILSLQRSVLGMLVNIILNILLIPHFGLNGSVIATLISFAMATFFFDLLQKRTRKMFYMKLRALNIFSSIRRLIC